MFDRFTEQVRRAVVLSKGEAHSFNDSYIGTEHILLGLVRESDSMAGRGSSRTSASGLTSSAMRFSR